MTNKGKIKCVDGDFAVVSVIREGSCGDNCAMCSACKYSTVEVKAHTKLKVNIGDLVEFESDTASVYFGLITLFILPIIFPIVFYLIFINFNVSSAIVASVISFAFSAFLVYLLSKSGKYLKKVMPEITKVIKY